MTFSITYLLYRALRDDAQLLGLRYALNPHKGLLFHILSLSITKIVIEGLSGFGIYMG